MQIKAWWDAHPSALVGLPTGQNNLIVIDTDVDYGDTNAKDVIENGEDALPTLPPLPATLTIQTPSGGRHRYYRTDQPLRNSAGQIAPLIDVRANGGYVIAPPSMTMTGAYQHIEGMEIADLPMSWEMLCIPASHKKQNNIDRRDASRLDTEQPGNAFAHQNNWKSILEPLGWRMLYSKPDGKTYWTRPGKDDGVSAVTFGEDGPFYNHSSNGNLPANIGLSKFGVYATINHAGDYSSAARALRLNGYGSPITQNQSDAAKQHQSRETPPAAPQDPSLDIDDYWTISSLRSYTPNTTHYLVGQGFIRVGAATALIGGTGCGKSVLATQVGVCMATGKDILDHLRVHRPVRTAIIQAEDDQDTTKRNLTSIAEALAVDQRLLDSNLRIYHRVGLDPGSLAELCRHVHESFPFEMLIIDNYQSFLGAQDINSTEAFFTWRLHMESLIKSINTGLLILAHPTKPKTDANKSALHSREGVYTAAGTSAFANWVRTSMELVLLSGEDERVALRFSKNAERTDMTDEHGKIVRQLLLQRSSQIRPYWSLAQDQMPPMTATEKRIFDTLVIPRNQNLSQHELSELTGISQSSISKFRKKFHKWLLHSSTDL